MAVENIVGLHTDHSPDAPVEDVLMLPQLGSAISIVTTTLAHLSACCYVTLLRLLRLTFLAGCVLVGAHIVTLAWFLDSLSRCRPIPGISSNIIHGYCKDVDVKVGYGYFQEGWSRRADRFDLADY